MHHVYDTRAMLSLCVRYSSVVDYMADLVHRRYAELASRLEVYYGPDWRSSWPVPSLLPLTQRWYQKIPPYARWWFDRERHQEAQRILPLTLFIALDEYLGSVVLYLAQN
jgi:hypothetical protein